MSGQLSHAPSLVVRQLIIDLGLGADGGTTWPVFAVQEPDSPDNCVTVYDTVGRNQGRFQVGGEIQETHGTQIRVRAADANSAFVKADAIKKGLSQDTHLTVATVTDPGGYGTATQGYLFYNVSFSSGPIPLKDPNSDRKFATLNMVANLRET